MVDPVQLISSVPLGTRMTVRKRSDDGYADALGYLRERTEMECVIETKRGLVSVELAEVTAVRLVPPPPAPRGSTASPTTRRLT